MSGVKVGELTVSCGEAVEDVEHGGIALEDLHATNLLAWREKCGRETHYFVWSRG
jgi:hypothetical protein